MNGIFHFLSVSVDAQICKKKTKQNNNPTINSQIDVFKLIFNNNAA